MGVWWNSYGRLVEFIWASGGIHMGVWWNSYGHLGLKKSVVKLFFDILNQVSNQDINQSINQGAKK